MGWILIAILWFGIMGLILKKTKNDDVLGVTFIVTFFSALIFLAVSTATSINSLDSLGYTQEIRKWELPIYSLRDGESLEGSFVLGSGSVFNTDYYYFYQDSASERIESFQLNRVEAFSVKIVEDDTQEPKYVRYGPCNVSYNWFWLHPLQYFRDPDKYLNRAPYAMYSRGNYDKWDRYLIVPEGTIVRNFKVQ